MEKDRNPCDTKLIKFVFELSGLRIRIDNENLSIFTFAI